MRNDLPIIGLVQLNFKINFVEIKLTAKYHNLQALICEGNLERANQS